MSEDIDPLFTTPSEDSFSGRLACMEKLSFLVAGGRKNGEEDVREHGDPTAGLGSPGGGGADSGTVADDEDISDVEVIKMNDIKKETGGDDAYAAPGNKKETSRGRKKRRPRLLAQCECCNVLPIANVLLCAFALHTLSFSSPLPLTASIAIILFLFLSCPIASYRSSGF